MFQYEREVHILMRLITFNKAIILIVIVIVVIENLILE